MIVYLVPTSSLDGPLSPAEAGAAHRARTVVGPAPAVERWAPWLGGDTRVVEGTWSAPEAAVAGVRAALAKPVEAPVAVLLPADPRFQGAVRDALSSWPGAGAGGHAPRLRTVETVPDAVLADGTWLGPGDVGPWLADRPLLGWTVVVTRPAHQARALAEPLRRRGARVWEAPTIELRPPADPAPLAEAVAGVGEYDWVLFTSANAVTAFRRTLFGAGRDGRSLAGCRVAAVGTATAEALSSLGIRPDVLPEEFVAESLLQALSALEPWEGTRVLLPRAAVAREVLPDGLRALGARVDVVEAYRTEVIDAPPQGLREALDDGRLDLVSFTSSSTVQGFRALVGDLGRARAVAIGPVAAEATRDAGFDLAAVADPHTSDGVVRACEELARDERS